jgi:hypothetical protein
LLRERMKWEIWPRSATWPAILTTGRPRSIPTPGLWKSGVSLRN